jgi:hypothetical protein
MDTKFNGTTVETNGVRTLAGGGTGAATAAAARANLGLGTAATTAASAYATAAQGAKADSALQSGAAISSISGLQTALDAKAAAASLAPGTVANAIVRASGTGNNVIQGSDLVIDDATTSTANNVAITNQHVGQTNSSLVLTPKGTGALIAGPKPDGTTTGGNARGSRAVDLQTIRTAITQVASGNQSTVSGGGNNTASGLSSTISGGSTNTASGTNSTVSGGTTNTASGTNSTVSGGTTNTASSSNSVVSGGRDGLADRSGMRAHSAGQFAAQGDAQHGIFVLRCKTTTNTAVEMALDGGTTYLTIPSGKVMAMKINISGVRSDGSTVAHYLRQYAVKNVGGTSSQVYAPVTIGTDNISAIMGITGLALYVNDTDDTFRISVTGVLSQTWRWVAIVDAVEIAYGT